MTDDNLDTGRLDDVALALLWVNSAADRSGATAPARPEGDGGPWNYQRIYDALANPAEADEYTEELLEWLDGNLDPEVFDASKVKFGSAARRLKELRSSMR